MAVFLIGLWIGGAVGALAVAIFFAAAQADAREPRTRARAAPGLTRSAAHHRPL